MEQQIEVEIEATPPVLQTNNARTVEDFAAEIRGAFVKGVAAFIEVGRLLKEAKAELDHGEWGNLVKDNLPFDDRTAQRFMAIAGNPILANPTHVSVLPPAWGTLYELSRLSEKVLKAKIADGTIHPRMERKDAVALEPKRTPKRSPPARLTLLTINKQLRSELDQQRNTLRSLKPRVKPRRRLRQHARNMRT